MMPAPEPPGLTFAFEARVDVGTPVTIGETPAGTRRIVPILGGSFEGPHLRASCMPAPTGRCFGGMVSLISRHATYWKPMPVPS